MLKTAVIVNPRSANGRTGKAWALLEPRVREVLGEFKLCITQKPGHATELVQETLKDGYTRIVSVGGDGTHHEVLNGFFENGEAISPDAVMAILPQGTGSDLARTLGIPSGEEAVTLLASNKTIASDVGRVEYTVESGEGGIEYFLNVAHIGFGGAVAERVNRHSKALGGFMSFLVGVVKTLFTYRNPLMNIEIDGERIKARVNDIIIANGKYDGGGMLVAPEAELDSSVFEVLIIGDIGPIEGVLNIPRLYKGTLQERPDRVRHLKARRITARSEEQVLINLEGEQPGALPACFEVVAGAIRLVVPE